MRHGTSILVQIYKWKPQRGFHRVFFDVGESILLNEEAVSWPTKRSLTAYLEQQGFQAVEGVMLHRLSS